MFHCEAVKIWHEYYEDFKNHRLGQKLSPFEKYEVVNDVLLKDTPGSVDGLPRIEKKYVYKRGSKQ